MPGEEDENQSLLDSLAELPAESDPSPLPEGENLAEGMGSLSDDAGVEELAAALDSIDSGDASGFEGLPDAIPEGLPDGIPEGLPEGLSEGADPLANLDEPLNPDPALDVEQLLASEVAPEALSEAMPAVDSGSQPTFQLQLELKSAPKEALKALAESLSIKLPEGDAPLLSQLTEYQAIAFRQGALALGAVAKASIHFPLPALTEEDQALGDLAMVRDNPLPVSEGAPSIALPKNEKEVMVLTFADSAPDLQVHQTLGLVTAHCSIARRFFREEEAHEKLRKEVERLPGRNSGIPASRLEALLRDLILDLQKMALQKGGNALLGLRLESFPETSHLDPELEQLRLVAFGTAAIVEKALHD